MSDKHEPAKPAHATDKKDDHGVQKELDAKIPHQQAVEEGVKAAESHRATTQDRVEAEHKPVKPPAPHALVGKATKLLDKVADVAKKHKEDVLELRDELQKLLYEVPADIPGHSLNSVHSVATRIEEGINMLDPDCAVKAPG